MLMNPKTTVAFSIVAIAAVIGTVCNRSIRQQPKHKLSPSAASIGDSASTTSASASIVTSSASASIATSSQASAAVVAAVRHKKAEIEWPKIPLPLFLLLKVQVVIICYTETSAIWFYRE